MNKRIAIELGWILVLFLVSLLGAYNPTTHTVEQQVVFTFPEPTGSMAVKIPVWMIVGGVFFLLVFLVYLIRALLYRFQRRVSNVILLLASIGLVLSIGYFKTIFSCLP